jgi:hypothetical protein
MATTARATVSIEINCKSNWNDTTTVAQVKEQATADAMQVLNDFAKNSTSRIKITGNPKITVITFDDN